MNFLRPARLLLLYDALRASYLFVPSLMLLGGATLALLLVRIDKSVENDSLHGLWWIFSGGAEGARALLSTVSGSSITVAGTVFSITIATLSLTSSQFGPRLLRGFLRDTGNQMVLGTFLSTFLYCLLVQRTVRSVEEVYFVPHIAVTGGVALALASVFMLVYYIHHITISIQAEKIIEGVARELEESIDTLFPQEIGTLNEDFLVPDGESEAAVDLRPLLSEKDGYILAVDSDALLQAAAKADIRVYLNAKPGQFVTKGETLAQVAPRERATGAVMKTLRETLSFGRQRTGTQDVTFVVEQLTEVAVRALSPGINDPYTALHCIDWLGASLRRLARRKMPSSPRCDENRVPRLWAQTLSFADVLEAAFSEIRLYGKSDRRVMLRLMETLGKIARSALTQGQKDAVRHQASLTLRAGEEALTEAEARAELQARYNDVLQSLRNTLADV